MATIERPAIQIKTDNGREETMPQRGRSGLRLALLGLLCMAGLSPAIADDPFYKGRVINIIVSGGGAYDAYARLLAKYMPKYIPGQPSMIVQGMPGGGGLRAASYLYKIAPKDGTTIAGLHGAVLTAPLLSPDVADFDCTKFTWLGNATRDVYVGYVRLDSPVRTMEDLRTMELIAGGSSVGGAGVDMAIIARDLFGLKVKVVSGYKTSQETKLAMDKGEISGTIASGYSSLKRTDLWADRKVRIIHQLGSAPHPELADVPLFRAFARSDEERQMLDIMSVREEISKPYLAPPGIPADRAEILRRAFTDAIRDPGFKADADRQQLELEQSLTGEELSSVVTRISTTPKSVTQRLVAVFSGYNEGK